MLQRWSGFWYLLCKLIMRATVSGWVASFARFARIRRMFEISWAMLDGLMGAEGVKA